MSQINLDIGVYFLKQLIERGKLLDVAAIGHVTACPQCHIHNDMIDHGIYIDANDMIMHAKPLSDRTSWQEWTDICHDHNDSAIAFPAMYFPALDAICNACYQEPCECRKEGEN